MPTRHPTGLGLPALSIHRTTWAATRDAKPEVRSI
jgi:hypothetical protein